MPGWSLANSRAEVALRVWVWADAWPATPQTAADAGVFIGYQLGRMVNPTVNFAYFV